MSDQLSIIQHKCTYDEYERKFPDNVNVNMAEVLHGTAPLSLALTTTTTTATAHVNVSPNDNDANQNQVQGAHKLSGQTGEHPCHANSTSQVPGTTGLHLYPRSRMSYDDYETAFPNNVNINMAEVLEKKSLMAASVEAEAKPAYPNKKKTCIVKKKKKTVLVPAPISAIDSIQSPTKEDQTLVPHPSPPAPPLLQKSVKSPSSSPSVDPRSLAMLRRPPFKNAVHV